MKDVIEENKISYNEKYRLLRQAGNLELRRRKTYGLKFVIAGSSSKIFLTRFFANRYFDKIVKKHNLMGFITPFQSSTGT